MSLLSFNRGQPGITPYYPMVGYYFGVQIDGIYNFVDSKFQEVSGITMELEKGETIKEGGDNNSVIELPGRTTYSDLVLKRGMLKPDTDLSDWCFEFFNNDFSSPLETRDIYVLLYNDRGIPIMNWLFESCYPKKMEIGGFNSTSTGEASIVVEKLTMKFQSFKKISLGMLSLL